MCFWHDGDYDWYPNVIQHTDGALESPANCMECERQLTVGEMVHRIHMEEVEGECKACFECECECEEGKCCQCESPEPGEEYDYVRCQECSKFLDAVKAAEMAAGCGEHESQPLLANMIEDIQNEDIDEAKKYFLAARRMYPELKDSGYLGRLWNQMFV